MKLLLTHFVIKTLTTVCVENSGYFMQYVEMGTSAAGETAKMEFQENKIYQFGKQCALHMIMCAVRC